jgi:3-methyl-2-oxobutanoate hydroxymethyltransferase
MIYGFYNSGTSLMKITKETLIARKKNKTKITMLTGYDFPTARLLDQCGIDVQLIGDSVGTNMLGYSDVSQVTVADMLHHLKAVARGVQKSFILCDMPFGSFETRKLALKNARLFCNNGADGVKIESEKNAMDKIRYVASHGITVCTHIGYTPQTPGLSLSVQGKDVERAKELVALAQESERAGAFMIVLELIPEKLAKLITGIISIPTIGIGAGRYCDGQVQVILDILGLSEKLFRHAKKYTDAAEIYADAVTAYINDVRNGFFPTEKNISSIPDEVLRQISDLFDENRILH